MKMWFIFTYHFWSFKFKLRPFKKYWFSCLTSFEFVKLYVSLLPMSIRWMADFVDDWLSFITVLFDVTDYQWRQISFTVKSRTSTPIILLKTFLFNEAFFEDYVCVHSIHGLFYSVWLLLWACLVHCLMCCRSLRHNIYLPGLPTIPLN